MRTDLALLTNLLKRAPGTVQLDAMDRDRVVRLTGLARVHGVEPWLASIAPVGDVWEPLRQQRLRFAAAVAYARRELRQFAGVAGEVECPWAVVKGVAVGEDVYPSPAMRFGVDIDVLVPPDAMGSLLDGLDAAGWELMDGNWPLIERLRPGELSVRSPTGGHFDLHWHVVNERNERCHVWLPTVDLLARRRRLPSGLPTLSREDQLIHLALHAVFGGANRLQWLLDIDRAAGAVDDWATVSTRARAAGVGLGVTLGLLRTRRALATALPQNVLTAMGSGTVWRSLCAAVDLVSPLTDDPSARDWTILRPLGT